MNRKPSYSRSSGARPASTAGEHLPIRPVLAFCGTPGEPRDLEELQIHLGNRDLELVGCSGIAQAERIAATRGSRSAVAYSRGCALALEWARRAGPGSVDSLVLIAPFLERGGKPTLLRLSRTPLIGDLLLRLVAKPLVSGFLRRTALPDAPTPGYLAKASIWSRPDRLRMAFEPSEADAHAAIRSLAANPPRILALAGSEDTASVAATDVLRTHLHASCHILSQAGHALPWTRPEQVARAIDEFLQEQRT